MINYLAAEFNQLLKKKNFFICLAGVILASISNILIVLIVNPGFESITHARLQEIMLRFISNKFVAIIIIFVTTVFITGINGNNIKNAITLGYSRSEIYFSKIILGTVVIAVLLLSSMLSTFIFAGIWMPELFTVEACWEAIIRYALVALLYFTQFFVAITLCYVINSNTLFAIIYFILFLVLTEIIETISNLNASLAILSNLTITHLLDEIIYLDGTVLIWPYIVSCSFVYSIFSMVVGAIIINKKDIK